MRGRGGERRGLDVLGEVHLNVGPLVGCHLKPRELDLNRRGRVGAVAREHERDRWGGGGVGVGGASHPEADDRASADEAVGVGGAEPDGAVRAHIGADRRVARVHRLEGLRGQRGARVALRERLRVDGAVRGNRRRGADERYAGARDLGELGDGEAVQAGLAHAEPIHHDVHRRAGGDGDSAHHGGRAARTLGRGVSGVVGAAEHVRVGVASSVLQHVDDWVKRGNAGGRVTSGADHHAGEHVRRGRERVDDVGRAVGGLVVGVLAAAEVEGVGVAASVARVGEEYGGALGVREGDEDGAREAVANARRRVPVGRGIGGRGGRDGLHLRVGQAVVEVRNLLNHRVHTEGRVPDDQVGLGVGQEREGVGQVAVAVHPRGHERHLVLRGRGGNGCVALEDVGHEDLGGALREHAGDVRPPARRRRSRRGCEHRLGAPRVGGHHREVPGAVNGVRGALRRRTLQRELVPGGHGVVCAGGAGDGAGRPDQVVRSHAGLLGELHPRRD
mmetsp:Transcript_2471/g.9836  ORF Transcript_2471/g.9836 Transcript_2471/m.9836 type:complete len:503 (-) Transcript_2471:168-1676(-)